MTCVFALVAAGGGVDRTAELPARVTILRPPTFERLREHLRERPAYYHIVHFDGHGGYGTGSVSGDGAPHLFRGPQGCWCLKNEHGQPDPVPADRLGALLREYRIPVMVLNACQSAMVDDRAEDAFASVAASLLRAGFAAWRRWPIPPYVSGAEEFCRRFTGVCSKPAIWRKGCRPGGRRCWRRTGESVRGAIPVAGLAGAGGVPAGAAGFELWERRQTGR